MVERDGSIPLMSLCFCFFFAHHREDMYSQDSIDLLQNSGLQFKKHEEEGIDTLYFAELLMTSGLVLCENTKWLSFHRSAVCSDSALALLVPFYRALILQFLECYIIYLK